MTEVTFVKGRVRLIYKDFQRICVFVIEQYMKLRIFILVSAAVVTLGPMVLAQQAGSGSAFSFSGSNSQPSVSAHDFKPRAIEGQRDVLELMADSLDFSSDQKSQLSTLMGHQHDLLAAMHKHTDLTDEQKSAQFQQIRRQTKEQFVAMLTQQQKKEFQSMMR